MVTILNNSHNLKIGNNKRFYKYIASITLTGASFGTIIGCLIGFAACVFSGTQDKLNLFTNYIIIGAAIGIVASFLLKIGQYLYYSYPSVANKVEKVKNFGKGCCYITIIAAGGAMCGLALGYLVGGSACLLFESQNKENLFKNCIIGCVIAGMLTSLLVLGCQHLLKDSDKNSYVNTELTQIQEPQQVNTKTQVKTQQDKQGAVNQV